MKNLFINMLAAFGFISLIVIAINTANAGVSAIADAFARQDAGQAAMIADHKAYLASDDDNYVTDPMNGFDEEIAAQEQAEKDKQIAHANAFLARVNGD